MDLELHLLEVEESMKKAVDYFLHELSSIRTGKASPALVENIDIYVNSYGSSMKLKQLAMITTPEPRLLLVQPFDAATTHDIDRGLKESRLGINPSIDGKYIRLPIPELSTERRREMVKITKNVAEEGRVRVRAVRRDGMEALKKAEKAGEITEDEQERAEKEIQALTDKMVKEIEVHLEKKEKEIMTV